MHAEVVDGPLKVVLEDEIAVGMRKGFGSAGGRATKVPLDVPKVLDERCEFGRWDETLVKEGAAAGFGRPVARRATARRLAENTLARVAFFQSWRRASS